MWFVSCPICRFCNEKNKTSEHILGTCGVNNALQEVILAGISSAKYGIVLVETKGDFFSAKKMSPCYMVH